MSTTTCDSRVTDLQRMAATVVPTRPLLRYSMGVHVHAFANGAPASPALLADLRTLLNHADLPADRALLAHALLADLRTLVNHS